MGFYVHIHVAFAVNDAKQLRVVAQRNLDKIKEAGLPSGDVSNFLVTLAKGEGVHPGPKGELCTWGHIGNYTNAAEFVEVLKPFWRDLYREHRDETGEDVETVFDFQRILVFAQAEQTYHAQAWQVGLEDGELKIVHFDDLPFSWGM